MSLTKTLNEHRASARRQYRKLVAAIQAGGEVNAEMILSIIGPVGKTGEDLQADVDRLTERIQAAEELTEATQTLPLAIKAAEAGKLPMIAEFNRVKAECDERLGKLAAPIRALDSNIREMKAKITSLHAPAAQLLSRTATRAVDVRLQQIQAEIRAEQGQINQMQDAIDYQTEALEELVKEFELKQERHDRMEQGNHADLAEPREKATKARQRLAEFEHDYKPTIARCKEHIAELEALKRTVEQDRLDPFQLEFFQDEEAELLPAEMIEQ